MMVIKQLTQRISMFLLVAVVTIGCGRQQETREPRTAVNAPPKTASHDTDAIEIGTAIESLSFAMLENGFEETMLDMQSRDPRLSLKMWSVGDGALVVLYDKSDSKLEQLEYLIITDGPKSTRQEFTMKVKRFTSKTGELVLTVDTPHKETE